MYYGISLLLMIPFGIVLLGLVVAYLIYNRYKDKKSERFEKREN